MSRVVTQGATLVTALFKSIYVLVALLITLIALVGFWPTYFGPMLAGTVDTIPLIHFHAVVYVTWLALFITQAAFAATGRLAIHVGLGRWLMAYGVVVIFIGTVLAFERFGAGIATGNLVAAQRKLFGPLRDILFFLRRFLPPVRSGAASQKPTRDSWSSL